MSYSDTNYSLGVLIILLMVFWFVCKCIGQNQYHYMIEQERMENQPEFIYGDVPLVLGSPDGMPYIRVNSTNMAEVPNSKTAYRNLMDFEQYKCGLTNRIADDPSTMHLQKKHHESHRPNPISLTYERKMHNVSSNDLKPMPSY